ncbi:MAG: hypothetical protein V3T58_07670 [Candidatus Hydrothermarchaeales archaeon]
MSYKVAILLAIMILFGSGCVGEKPEVTETPVPTTQPPIVAPTTAPPVIPTTTSPPTTTPPPTTSPPTTTPPPTPASKFLSASTALSDIIPTPDTVKALSDADYDFTLKFPIKTKILEEGIKATYKSPTGTIYLLKYTSAGDAEDFFNAIVEKSSWKGTPMVERTLTVGSKTLTVYHKIEYKEYFGTLFKRGLFIYYVTMGKDDFNAELYIKQNMDYLFDGEPHPEMPSLPPILEGFSSPATSINDLVPKGAAKIESMPKAEYEYTLKYPPKTSGYVKDITATYELPIGKIYVSKFDTVGDAEAFLELVKEKYLRAGKTPVEKTLVYQGRSLPVIHEIAGNVYYGTLIHKGLFVYNTHMGNDDFDADYYIRREMGYLFE